LNQTKTNSPWKPFHIDSRKFNGAINSRIALLLIIRNTLNKVFAKPHLAARYLYRTRLPPNWNKSKSPVPVFGDGIDFTGKTLEQWARENGMQLPLFSDD
jgi:hypothetical protein